MATEKAEFAVELEDDVTPGARKASSSLDRLRKRFEKFNKSAAGRAISKFSSAAKQMITMAATVGAGVAAGLGAMTTSMVDFNQRSKVAFDRLAKAGEVPEELFQRSIDLAKRFGLDIKDTTKQIAKFRALQFNQDQAEALIKMGSDMQALGASTDEVNRIFSQLGQIQAKGKLQGEELIVLAENGLSTQLVYENLEKQLGKSRDEILKMQQAGKIDSSSALKAIGAAILQKTNTTEFGQAGQAMADSTIGGMAGKLKAGFQDTFHRAAEKAEGPVTTAFGKISERIGKFLEDPATSDAIGTTVATLANAISTAMPFIERFVSAFAEGFMNAWPGIKSGFETLLELFGSIGGSESTGDTIARIGTALGEVAAILAGAVVAAIGIVIGLVLYATSVWNFWKGVLMSFVEAIAGVVFAVTDFFSDIGAIFDQEGLSLFDRMVKIGKHIVEGLVNGLNAMISAPGKVIDAMGAGLVDAMKGVLRIGSPSKVFEDIGMNISRGLAIGVEGEEPMVRGTMSDLVNPAGLGFSSPGGGSQTINFSPKLTIAMPQGATREDGEAFGRGVAEGMRSDRHIMRFLEGVAIEGGT